MGGATPSSATMAAVTNEVKQHAAVIRSRRETVCLVGDGWRAYATLIDTDTVAVSLVLPSSLPAVCCRVFTVKV